MEDKKHSFMDQLNLFFIGAVIGVIVGACFGINAVKGSNNRAEKKVKAYEEYYKCTETLFALKEIMKNMISAWNYQ